MELLVYSDNWRTDRTRVSDEVRLYAIQCEEEFVYVGTSKDVYKRLDAHWVGDGAEATKLYLPRAVLFITPYTCLRGIGEPAERWIQSYLDQWWTRGYEGASPIFLMYALAQRGNKACQIWLGEGGKDAIYQRAVESTDYFTPARARRGPAERPRRYDDTRTAGF